MICMTSALLMMITMVVLLVSSPWSYPDVVAYKPICFSVKLKDGRDGLLFSLSGSSLDDYVLLVPVDSFQFCDAVYDVIAQIARRS